ncbi:sigma-54-dependent transcriptional regulator [Desulfobulbus oligotrophicus]|uniref:Sigma-54-dependent Fis family transcriptional regulator n=1 Tax=Desulfobulbus oligotrophicus TaxID=1909699 RepID=A0A7T5VCG1_9BACT|nr:sigma-54 dependent transcriptional regulator [Desulfobulbus oligotrophicus]QQG65229.1 sigma-54-dependent Fis family transcriptional regulator [Desulfobulbus oligotrophicus]
MQQQAYSVLVIDDEESIRRLLEKELSNERRAITTAADAVSALTTMRSHWFDVILMDLRLPDVSGLDLLIQTRELAPHTEVIMVTGHGDIDIAVEAMKLGAYDFIRKPFHLDRLDLLVERAHHRVQLARENDRLRHNADNSLQSVRFIGNSQIISEIQFLIKKVAPAKIPVLITGESGVGKDVVARAIHQGSPLSVSPMVVKNCASLQKELARSELFGHVKGAFTGADVSQEGLLSFAHGSTLFLDEIGELPLEVQASLLRVLETGSYRRVGEKEERTVDIRFVFATNRHLQEEVEQGRFNEALFHRINAFNIHVPSLRRRKEDIPLLVDYFLATLGTDQIRYRVVDSAMDCILNYNWPGNIRELRNVIERSIILAENGMITERCLPGELIESAETEGSALSLESIEKQHILKLLNAHGGNRQKTAEVLGISRKTLYRKLQQYSIS